MSALKRDTDLKVPEPIARRDGECITIVSVPGVPDEQRCVLFKWIPGRALENYPSPENYYKLGQVLAILHNQASTLKPLPPHIQPKRWDRVFYYPDEPVAYDAPEYGHLFPPGRIELLEKVIEQADAVFARLFADKDGQILIHGDLHYWNIHLYRGELYVFDFKDVNLGYPVQDVAVTLAYGRQRDGYAEWRAAFKQAYSSVREWPMEGERTIETMIAARSVMFINYVARMESSPQEHIEQRCAALVQFLKAYG